MEVAIERACLSLKVKTKKWIQPEGNKKQIEQCLSQSKEKFKKIKKKLED